MATSGKAKSPNLKDNIKNMDFDIKSFIDTSEAAEYLSQLPGISDLINAGKTLFANIKDFIDKIKAFIDKILAMFGLDGLFDKLGLKNLFDNILGWVDKNMKGMGFPLEVKNMIAGLFEQLCGTFNSDIRGDYRIGFDLLNNFTLMGVLLAMLCNGVDSAYGELTGMLKGKFTEDTEYMTPSKLVEYTAKKEKHDDDVDKMLASTLVPVLVNMKSGNNQTFMVELSAQTGLLGHAKQGSKSVGTAILNSLGNYDLKGVSVGTGLDTIESLINTLSPDTMKDISKLRYSKGYTRLAARQVKVPIPSFRGGPRPLDTRILALL